MEWQGRYLQRRREGGREFPVGENTKLGGGTQYRAAEKPHKPTAIAFVVLIGGNIYSDALPPGFVQKKERKRANKRGYWRVRIIRRTILCICGKSRRRGIYLVSIVPHVNLSGSVWHDIMTSQQSRLLYVPWGQTYSYRLCGLNRRKYLRTRMRFHRALCRRRSESVRTRGATGAW